MAALGSRGLQRWPLIPDAQFQVAPCVAIRSQDQTRALLFFFAPDDIPVGTIPAGRLRFDWLFTRDLGPGAPLLKRDGRTDPEVVTLELTVPAAWP